MPTPNGNSTTREAGFYHVQSRNKPATIAYWDPDNDRWETMGCRGYRMDREWRTIGERIELPTDHDIPPKQRVQDCCGTCIYWSELLAYADASGVYAWCLNQDNDAFAPSTERYTHTDHACPHHVFGYYAIDDPHHHEENDQ